jgi:hypothetical protein
LWVHELIAGWVIMASRPIADFADYIGRLPALVELLPLWVAEQIGLVQAWTSEQFGLLQAWVLEQQWLPGWMLWMLEWPIELLKGIVWWLFELLRWLLPWLAELIVPLVRAALESMVQPLQDWLTSIEAWMVSLAN